MLLVRRHPLITFFVLTYALAWILESPLVFLRDSITDAQGQILYILSANVVSVVAIVLTAMVLGRGALRKLLGRLLIWRVNPLWYLGVVLGPAALVGGVVALNALLGRPALSLGIPSLLGLVIMLAFMIVPGSALGEEIGWRGYALPRLQTRMSALSASLILGVMWGFYHLPLYFTGQAFRPPSLFAPFVIGIIALSVILTWVYNSTGGSLLLVVLLHATINLPLTLLLEPLGSRMSLPVWLYFALLVVAALVVVIVAGPEHLSRQHHKQEEKEAEEPGGATPPGAVKPAPA
jgi:membrane protease YdiL (CAAX protease family)